MQWFIYGLLGMFCFSLMILGIKGVLLLGFPPTVILLLIFGFGAIFYGIHVMLTKTPLNMSYSVVIIIVIIAFCSYLGNLFYLHSLKLAPNPGYATALNSLLIIGVTLGAILLFKSEFTMIKGIGMVLAILSIVLLSF